MALKILDDFPLIFIAFPRNNFPLDLRYNQKQ